MNLIHVKVASKYYRINGTNANQIVQCCDPWVFLQERLLLFTRPPRPDVRVPVRITTRSVNADCLQTWILASDPPNKRLGNWTRSEIVEMLEGWKSQDRKEETFRSHCRA